MAESERDFFVTGLRNAHAMEMQARELMERQIDRTHDYPELRTRLQQHLVETTSQLERLESVLKEMGESSSTVKDTALSMMGNVSAMMHAASSDEIIKNMLANNMFENFEIGTYKSLIAMCGRVGTQHAETLLRSSLTEEENMARWVDEHIEPVTLAFLARVAHDSPEGRARMAQ
ncbi:MAG: ferritin-like domain-containing protein [Hyphomicrobium sp.]|nr:ferritin-like domain-containing protein [Hyphomicrobium sp.]